MPTSLPRIQTLCPPDLFEEVTALARLTQKSNSFMVVELIEEALQQPKYQALLEYAYETKEHVSGSETRHRVRRHQAVRKLEPVRPTPTPASKPNTGNWWETAS